MFRFYLSSLQEEVEPVNVLNLYAGLGGNRKLWSKDITVTSVEINSSIAEFYQSQFPGDKVVVGDAHSYLLENYRHFDFIWSSVPCQTHSRARRWANREPHYIDMKLYQEVLFLRTYFAGKWVVENVQPFYSPLITPTRIIGRHSFWSNMSLIGIAARDLDILHASNEEREAILGFSINNYCFDTRKDTLLRNCVHPQLGKEILDRAISFNQVQNGMLFNVETPEHRKSG